MTKIVYNACYGGFGLSTGARERYIELAGLDENQAFYDFNLDRTDPILVQVIEELGQRANGRYAELYICELPEGTRYRIDEYDGLESVMTPDDYDWSIA